MSEQTTTEIVRLEEKLETKIDALAEINSESNKQVVECLKHLISLQEKQLHTDKEIESLKASDEKNALNIEKQSEKITKLDKDMALSNQAAKSMESTAKEIKDTLKTGAWKLIGFTVGVIALIVSVIVTVAVALIK